MTLEQWKAAPDSPEADALAVKVLTSLYTIYAREHGYDVTVKVERK